MLLKPQTYSPLRKVFPSSPSALRASLLSRSGAVAAPSVSAFAALVLSQHQLQHTHRSTATPINTSSHAASLQ
ncbi:hypothetical protein Naga_100055g21 [Nannochloropsis gaditana]|uniref:Uncharacterized protein n=1 Tax=Nannochloropsis gaditana TaxID=72520 RepID=W7TMC2_9STRA|nr:hypothetical protein Naga_100055g21 [Nannochloropsis gaditana]